MRALRTEVTKMSTLFDLTGKVAAVTGASSGLGLQMAKALARQGADVALLARRIEKLHEAKAEIEKIGVRCLPVQCDVLDNAQITAAVKTIKDHYGKIDILVNNAGIGLFAPAEETPDELWNKMVDMNLSSVFFVAREFGKEMVRKSTARSSTRDRSTAVWRCRVCRSAPTVRPKARS